MKIICDSGRITAPGGNGKTGLRDIPGPAVVLVHGYSFDPTRPGADNPFETQFMEWKRALGDRRYVEFGWYSAPRTARGILDAWRNGHATTYGRAWSLAEQAGGLLAAILNEASGPVSIVAHSLGTRVACEALNRTLPGKVGRVLFWNGAEYVRNARRTAIARPDILFLNVAARCDDVLERLGDVFAPGSGRCVGNDGLAPDAPANWTDVFLDDSASRDWAAATGASLRGDDPRSIGDHRESFRHRGNWPLYRAFLDGAGIFGIPGDDTGAGDDPDAVFRWYLDRLLAREGGDSERPVSADPGGVTRNGISQRFLDALNDRTGGGYPASVLELSDAEIAEIYRAEFYAPLRIPALSGICREAGIDRRLPEILFDIGVMSGTGNAARLLQRGLAGITGDAVVVDGIVGPETLACFRSVTGSNRAEDLLAAIIRSRLAFLDSLPHAAANPGWRRRTLSFREQESV